METYKKKALLTKDVAKENLNALKENMDLLKRFSKFPSAGRDNIEKMLNFI